jgi:hypothetical protein
MGNLRDCGACIAREEMLDLVAQALGKELMAAHDGHHYEAVQSLVQAHRWMSEDTARMRAVIAEKQAEIDAWKEASGLERGGDPDGVTPDDLRSEIAHLRSTQEKSWCEDFNKSFSHSNPPPETNPPCPVNHNHSKKDSIRLTGDDGEHS